MARKKAAAPDIASIAVAQDTIYRIPIDAIEVRPEDNGRLPSDDKELATLAANIMQVGQLQPIGIKPGGTEGRFLLEWGFRRYAALRLLADKGDALNVAAVLATGDESSFLRTVSENQHRKSTTPLEDARNLKRLTDPVSDGGMGMSQKEAAKLYGHPQPWVSAMLAILGLPDDLQAQVQDGTLGVKVAQMIARCDETTWDEARAGKIKTQEDAQQALRDARKRQAKAIEEAEAAQQTDDAEPESEQPNADDDAAQVGTQYEGMDANVDAAGDDDAPSAKGRAKAAKASKKAAKAKKDKKRGVGNVTIARSFKDAKILVKQLSDKPGKSPLHMLGSILTLFLAGELTDSGAIKRISALFRSVQQAGMEPDDDDATATSATATATANVNGAAADEQATAG